MSPFDPNLWTAEIPKALCLTFLHSLWQGLVLALIAAFVILLSPKARPGLRYNMFGLLLGVFALSAVYTFILEYNTGITAAANAAVAPVCSSTLTLPDLLLYKTTGFINTHAGTLCTLWLLICSFKVLRLLQDTNRLHRLRHTGTGLHDVYWREQVDRLKTRLGIRGTIKLRESAFLSSPSVIGILKPVILLPIGMLSRLPAEQVEAVLLHELAHIKRKDYLVNLLQTALEAVFFFNPFLGWISARLRAERENCCDEIAVTVSGNKPALVQALIVFGEARLAPAQLAMALGGHDTLLLDRVRRIALNKNKSLNTAEKSFLALFSAAILAFLCTFSWNVQQLNSRKDAPYNPSLLFPANPGCAPADARPKTATLPAGHKPLAAAGAVHRSQTRTVTLAAAQTTTITTVNELPGTDTLALSKHIITDLTSEGIIEAPRLLSYRLNDEELVVNGVKQPEALHRKLKSKYVKRPGWAILYDLRSEPVTPPSSLNTRVMPGGQSA